MNIVKDFKPNNTIVKSNKLIFSSYNLNLIEQKIILSVLSLINPDKELLDVYNIKIKTFKEILGKTNSGSIDTDIKKYSIGLMKKPFSIEDNKTGDYLFFNWFSLIRYRRKEGILSFYMNDEIKEMFIKLSSNFTTFELKQVLSLKIKHSIRLYEILKSESYKKTTYIELEELKYFLGVENKYPRFGTFNQLLKKSQSEINETTNITFKYIPEKKGKKVIGITFEIILDRKKKEVNHNKDNIISDDIELIDEYTEIRSILNKYEVSPSVRDKFINEYSVEYLTKKLNQFEYELSTNKDKVYRVGTGNWIYKLIVDDFKNDKYDRELFNIEDKRIKKEKKITKEREKELYNSYITILKSRMLSYNQLDESTKKKVDKYVRDNMTNVNKSMVSSESIERSINYLREEYILNENKNEYTFEKYMMNRQ